MADRTAAGLDASQLRRASETGIAFPYRASNVTFILIAAGTVTQAKSPGDKRRAVHAAQDHHTALLLACWPGEWSQDIFVVDDLEAAMGALS